MNIKRSAFFWIIVAGVVATLPVFALDFHHWRTDGQHIRGTSIGQQSTNQAYNMFDTLLDVGSSSFALYWKGEHQENGGNTGVGRNAHWGDNPPTVALRDNREQDSEVDWTTWQVVTGKTLVPLLPATSTVPPRPLFTPNVPQAWSPIEVDMDTGSGNPDHVLIDVSFEPTAVPPAANPREQILNAYYPEMAEGLPNNSSALGPVDLGAVRPLWVRANGLPGLRIRDLAPLQASQGITNPGVGVVVQPPIFATVPAVYTVSGTTVTQQRQVVYLVVGTGEYGDFAKVICISLDRKRAVGADQDVLPNPAESPATIAARRQPPDPTFFNPTTGTGGDVMWCYTVRSRNPVLGVAGPVPVAGISFANIGTSADSRPLLFVTTADGQIICLNAKAADTRTFSQDGDPALTPVDDPAPRWVWQSPLASNGIDIPGFSYGMAPAVSRVPLTGLLTGTVGGPTEFTVNRALGQHGVTEWQLFVADTYGNFRSLEAGGLATLSMAGQITGYTPLQRWEDIPPGLTFRTDPNGNRERWITPPVVYQGNTPMRNSAGAIVAGSSDSGFDDEVIFSSEKGSVFAFDAIGELNVDRANATIDGTPSQRTALRWSWPNEYTTPLATDERRVWPRASTHPDDADNGALPADERALGRNIARDAAYFSRAPLGVSLGANANPDLGTPNLEPGDDAIYVPYMQEQPANVAVPELPAVKNIVRPPDTRWFYEYLGSLKPYGFVQTSHPILQINQVEVLVGATWRTMPLNRLRVGSIKANGLPVNQVQFLPLGSMTLNPNYDPTGIVPEDTVYFTATRWYDDATTAWYTLNFGDQVRITYDRPTAFNDATPVTNVVETLDYPSCFRKVRSHPFRTDADPAQVITFERTRASLSEARARLEGRRTRLGRYRTPAGADSLLEEEPAQVRAPAQIAPPDGPGGELFQNTIGEGIRQPAMFAAGSANLGGTLAVPSFFRGRVILLSNTLRLQRTLLGCYDPRLNPIIQTRFGSGVARPNNANAPNSYYGPVQPAATAAELLNTYDPGPFYLPPAPVPGDDPYTPDFSRDDFVACTDVGGSIVMVDGWLYVVYRNGHIRGFSNVGGGASGTLGGNAPYFEFLPGQGSNGTLVEAPTGDPLAPGSVGGIRILIGNRLDDVRRVDATGVHLIQRPLMYRDQLPYNGNFPDQSLMFEYGQTAFITVDFGDRNALAPPQSINPDDGIPEIDDQVLQNEVQAQVRSSNGAVQQLPGVTRGVLPQLVDHDDNAATAERVMAIVPVFFGIPSGSNPLTPGTPLLWERAPVDFANELTYDIQVIQQGVQWRWPDNPVTGNPNPSKTHFWEFEPNNGSTRFPLTAGQAAGTPNWSWTNAAARERAPLISYNNPLIVHYDPDSNPNAINGMWNVGTGTGVDTVALVPDYTDRNAPGRKNGDMYIQASLDGAHSGSGVPVVPTIGVALANGEPKQILFADHGKSTAPTSTVFPDLGRMRVGDRSHMGYVGRSLQVRVMAAPLTKMGVGAEFGVAGNAALQNLPGAPGGSFEQNVNIWDDGPDGLYASIPASRVSVVKDGTSLDLTASPVQISGRRMDQTGAVTFPGIPDLERLLVSVDVPPFTADDLFATRFRKSTQRGANPLNAEQTFNPFFPSTVQINGTPGRAYWDRAERVARPQQNPPAPVPNEDQPAPYEAAGPNQVIDDRTRRVVIFVDADGDGQLDLESTRREAYRTFAVQAMVKPDMKIEARAQQIDFGALWQGKKQAGMGAGVLDIREYQRMQIDKAGPPAAAALARFYEQNWRPFNLLNTGNVNLAYIKPEILYQNPNPVATLQLAIPGEGNDAWRALPLVNQATLAALNDPLQIFLRTGFDEQFLPNNTTAYAAGTRGVWLQKAPAGAGQPGSATYVDPQAVPTGNAIDRDPSVTGVARPTVMTLNLPTGTALGQYSGSIRWYNDRAVGFADAPGTGLFGYQYISPAGSSAASGLLERSAAAATFGDPVEPVTDPPFKIKAKVTENIIHGRYIVNGGAVDAPDRRMMPAVAADATQSSNGQVRRLILTYVANKNGVGSSRYDVWGSEMRFDAARFLFPFDEIPLVRDTTRILFGGEPWTEFNTPAVAGYTLLGGGPVVAGAQVAKPSLVQDAGTGDAFLSWTERFTGGGQDQFRVFYQKLMGANAAAARFTVAPQGQALDLKVARGGARMVPTPGGNLFWFMFYSLGSGTNRSLAYTWNQTDPIAAAGQTSWTPETTLPTSTSLSAVSDPHVFMSEAYNAYPNPNPQMTWVSFSGSSHRSGRADIYLSRFDLAKLATAGQRGTVNQLGRDQQFGLRAFPRVEGDVLAANPARTVYQAGGIDWVTAPLPGEPALLSQIQLYIGRPDLPPATPGSAGSPIFLINVAAIARATTGGEFVFDRANVPVPGINPAVLAVPGLQNLSVVVDAAAGIVRFNMDTRTIARLLVPAGMTTASPDPVVTADFRPRTLRITRGDVSANDPVVVPVLSLAGNPVMDASWYRQQLDGAKWGNGIPVAGQADRLWFFWRRAAGAVTGGPTCFYKVLRPGVRVRAGAISSVLDADLSITAIPGGAFRAEEVNPATGQIYVPYTLEGTQVSVRYRDSSGNSRTELHYIGWVDETGERAVPMDTSVNEGSLDAIVSYEGAQMTPFGSNTSAAVRKMERIWLFWSSTRGSGGDIYSAALAPRIGPEANVGTSALGAVVSGSALARLAPSVARQRLAQAAQIERRRPFTLPLLVRRGPFVPVPARPATRPATAAAAR